MIYLFTFILCIIADKHQNRNKTIYSLIILWLYIFLCFGYMTGSDWRNYELVYKFRDFDRFIMKGELGFVWIVKIFKFITDDFWIFNACMKIFFLYALIHFFKLFIDKPIMAVGFSFCFNTLFLLIDCPMRFMIAASFFLLSIRYLISQKWIQYILFLISAIFCHSTFLIINIILIIVYFLKSAICRFSLSILWIFFLVCIVISNSPIVKSSIDSIGSLTSYGTNYMEWYNENKTITLLASLKTLYIGTIVIFCKNKIMDIKNGEFIFSMSYFSLTLGRLITVIPTGFRLNIIPEYFILIVLIMLFFSYLKTFKLKVFIKCSIILLFSFLLIKEVKSSIYTPYSNSIYYIITDHLPYSYRYGHNYVPER